MVNFSVLADQSPHAKALQATLDREFGTRNRDLMQQAKDLQAKEEKFKRDAAVMAEAERSKAQKELVDGQRDAQRRANELKEDFELRRNEELRKLESALRLEVQSYAKAQNFDLILASEAVLFRKDTVDITSQVVAAMQAKSTAPAPAPAPKQSRLYGSPHAGVFNAHHLGRTRGALRLRVARGPAGSRLACRDAAERHIGIGLLRR